MVLLNEKDFQGNKTFESVLEIDESISELTVIWVNATLSWVIWVKQKIFSNGLKIDSSYEPILRNLVDLYLILQNFEKLKKL